MADDVDLLGGKLDALRASSADPEQTPLTDVPEDLLPSDTTQSQPDPSAPSMPDLPKTTPAPAPDLAVASASVPQQNPKPDPAPTDWFSSVWNTLSSFAAPSGSHASPDAARALDSTSTSSDTENVADLLWKSVSGVGETLQKTLAAVDIEHGVRTLKDQGAAALHDASAAISSLETMRVDDLLEKGKRSVQDVFKDDEEIAGDVPSSAAVLSPKPVAPWDALPEEERGHTQALREEMLKIVVDSIYSRNTRQEMFLSGIAAREKFIFDWSTQGHTALGALQADPNLKRLRAGLVPRLLKEDVFWNTYFYHVHTIRKELLANDGVVERDRGDSAPSDVNDVRPEVDNKKQARNWDDEIDKLFEDDE